MTVKDSITLMEEHKFESSRTVDDSIIKLGVKIEWKMIKNYNFYPKVSKFSALRHYDLYGFFCPY